MMKAVGSLLVFGGGVMLWWLQMQSRRRRRTVLGDLLRALRSMQEEIRMLRLPLPELLRNLAESCGAETANLLRNISAAVESGEGADAAWCTGVRILPISEAEQKVLARLSFKGDEIKVCKELSLAINWLEKRAEELERSRAEEEKQVAALCFSGAALLVILLV